MKPIVVFVLSFMVFLGAARADSAAWWDQPRFDTPKDLAQQRRDKRSEARRELATGIAFTTLSVVIGGGLMGYGAWSWKNHGSFDLLEGGGYELIVGSMAFVGLGVGGALMTASGISEQRQLDAAAVPGAVGVRF